ncbi:MAG: hypothetical protein KF813_01240 [Trueperaceae bacterium]|nr:hypothetical protein [Trueperaceae bacterium]
MISEIRTARRGGEPTLAGRLHRFEGLVLALAMLVVASVCSAQGVTSTGSSHATVMLTGHADLGSVVSIGIAAGTVTFDLRGSVGSDQVCVVSGTSADDIVAQPLFGETFVRPAGTTFRVTDYPLLEVEGGRQLAQGELPVSTAGTAIVCYRSFELKAFSNVVGWQVAVDRYGLPGADPIRNLYLAAVCRGEAAANMQRIEDLGRVSVFADKVAGSCNDALIVLAVKLGGETAGTSAAGLRYTIVSSAPPDVVPMGAR